ncbi:unnamed protein product [Diplocarpon coronariae]
MRKVLLDRPAPRTGAHLLDSLEISQSTGSLHANVRQVASPMGTTRPAPPGLKFSGDSLSGHLAFFHVPLRITVQETVRAAMAAGYRGALGKPESPKTVVASCFQTLESAPREAKQPPLNNGTSFRPEPTCYLGPSNNHSGHLTCSPCEGYTGSDPDFEPRNSNKRLGSSANAHDVRSANSWDVRDTPRGDQSVQATSRSEKLGSGNHPSQYYPAEQPLPNLKRELQASEPAGLSLAVNIGIPLESEAGATFHSSSSLAPPYPSGRVRKSVSAAPAPLGSSSAGGAPAQVGPARHEKHEPRGKRRNTVREQATMQESACKSTKSRSKDTRRGNQGVMD